MYRRLISSLLAVAVAASVVPSADAAGPLPTMPGLPGLFRPNRPTRPARTITVTTQTTTANLDMQSYLSPRGSIVYQTTTVSTTILGIIPISRTTTTLTGTINRTPAVDGGLVNFDLYYQGNDQNPGISLTQIVLLSNGTGSFSLSSARGDSIPVILPGDQIFAEAHIMGTPTTIQKALFWSTVTNTSTYTAP